MNIVVKMRFTTSLFFGFLFYFFTQNCASQDITSQRRDNNTLRVCFYNVENFFDYEDNPAKNDNAFTPEGSNHWTKTRFENKAENIAKVFVAMGQWDLPEIIGVCEIENETAIRYLLYNTPLAAGNYKYVYYESPDRRGINVAFFYKQDNFRVTHTYPIRLIDSLDAYFKTRDILYVQGVLLPDCADTLHLFVNHWTSRYGGYAATEGKRKFAAATLRLKIDSLLLLNPQARILVMGDFNDYPDNESIKTYLRASDTANYTDGNLINMMFPYFNKNNIGTYKYQQHWGILDQIMVSSGLFYAENGLRTATTGTIFSPDFLLEADKNMGKKPIRTYIGQKYTGGFSDHLPVYIDLKCY
jgi:predicted extracellular nuclease